VASPAYIVKFQAGASGVERDTFAAAMAAAKTRVSGATRPARVFRVGAPNVLLAQVWKDGSIDLTAEGAQEAGL
jgi:hypothetical protein